MSDANGEMKFDSLLPRRVKITIGDQRYFMEEMTEARMREFRKSLIKMGRDNKDGQVSEESLSLPTLLLSMCMFRYTGMDSSYVKLDADFLDGLPSSMIDALSRKARQINGLETTDEKATEEAKN